MTTRIHLQHLRAEYEFDFMYYVIRFGGAVEAVDAERLDDYYWGGLFAEEAAKKEIKAQGVEV